MKTILLTNVAVPGSALDDPEKPRFVVHISQAQIDELAPLGVPVKPVQGRPGAYWLSGRGPDVVHDDLPNPWSSQIVAGTRADALIQLGPVEFRGITRTVVRFAAVTITYRPTFAEYCKIVEARS